MQVSRRLIHLCLIVVLIVFVAWTVKERLIPSDPLAQRWVAVEHLPTKLAIYESVFWEPLDTESLRRLIRTEPVFVTNKKVLEIGTGSGLIALCCSEAGAKSVVATDINPNAVACATANARRMGKEIDIRLVPGGAASGGVSVATDAAAKFDAGGFAVIGPNEKFDLIISNPPWEDATAKQWSDYALYDQDFELLRSIIAGCREHLNPGGRLVLVYGCVEAIRVTRRLAQEYDMDLLVLDERDPESLPDVFLPGMMLGLLPTDPIASEQ